MPAPPPTAQLGLGGGSSGPRSTLGNVVQAGGAGGQCEGWERLWVSPGVSPGSGRLSPRRKGCSCGRGWWPGSQPALPSLGKGQDGAGRCPSAPLRVSLPGLLWLTYLLLIAERAILKPRSAPTVPHPVPLPQTSKAL